MFTSPPASNIKPCRPGCETYPKEENLYWIYQDFKLDNLFNKQVCPEPPKTQLVITPSFSTQAGSCYSNETQRSDDGSCGLHDVTLPWLKILFYKNVALQYYYYLHILSCEWIKEVYERFAAKYEAYAGQIAFRASAASDAHPRGDGAMCVSERGDTVGGATIERGGSLSPLGPPQAEGRRPRRHHLHRHRHTSLSLYRRLFNFVKQAWTGVKFALGSYA
ncbi:hypothetical protein J6590_034383 [Homalodisca vitripennis]|nr:hypothetical protein J6590_034382 [Homalodisca vitripennis]KAG8317014.1 hypothetical protein J6590_034383 [Homalodisca vitripennis]